MSSEECSEMAKRMGWGNNISTMETITKDNSKKEN